MNNIIDFNFILDEDMCAFMMIFRHFHYGENQEFFASRNIESQIAYNKYKNLRFDIKSLKNDPFIQQLKQTDKFKKLFEVAKSNYQYVLEDWKKYGPLAHNYITKTLKYDKPFKTIDVYVTNHSAFSMPNFIVWGHSNGYIPGYNVAYLTHEWLHKIEAQIFKNTLRTGLQQKFCHALIELCAEQTMSHKFGFDSKHFISHPHLTQFRKTLKPYFEEQLLNGDKTLEEFFVWTKENADNLNSLITKNEDQMVL